MNQRVQARQPLRVLEHQRGQTRPGDGAIGRKDFTAKFAHHPVVGLAAWRHHLAADFVGLNHEATPAGQRFTHECLTGGDAAGQTYFQHRPRRRSAEATVFDISMAMVSGPTPPGTGVYADARSAMAIGSTSPTSTLPFASKAASFSRESRKTRATSSRFASRLMPTSITTAPSRMKSGIIMAG